MSEILAVVVDPPAAVLLTPDNHLEPVPVDGVSGLDVGAVVGPALARLRTAGIEPDRVAVVVDDELDGPSREAVGVAVRAAGAAEVVSVPRSIAEARRPSGGGDRPGELVLAAGAALVARELPADPAPAPAPRPPPVDEPVVAEAAAPGAFAPGDDTLDHEIPRHRFSVLGVAIAIVLVLAGAAGAFLLLSGDDDTDTEPNPGTITEPPASSTTDPSTEATLSPDGGEGATPSTEGTTAGTNDEASEATAPPPTTEPVPVGDPGAVTLTAVGLMLDDGTVLRFGQGGDTVVDEITRVLGEPDDETEWEVVELCLGDRVRTARWGDLEVVLEETDGTGRFGQWYAAGADEPEGLVDGAGLGVGATVGFLEVTYGEALQIDVFTEGEPEGIFGITDVDADAGTGGGGVLIGSTTGLDPDATVTAVVGGRHLPAGALISRRRRLRRLSPGPWPG